MAHDSWLDSMKGEANKGASGFCILSYIRCLFALVHLNSKVYFWFAIYIGGTSLFYAFKRKTMNHVQ